MPKKKPTDCSIIIPCAGAGRLRRKDDTKSLIELSDRETVIGRQITLLRAVYPRAEIVVVAGPAIDRLYRKLPRNVIVVENSDPASTNIVRSIGLGLRASTRDHTLLLYGDLVFDRAILEQIPRASSVLVKHRDLGPDDAVGVTIVAGQVTAFEYGLDPHWCQIAYLTGREFGLFHEFCTRADRQICLGHEALNYILERGGQLQPVAIDGTGFVEIDRIKDVQRARTLVLQS